MYKTFTVLLLTLFFSGCSTMKIESDYDTAYNFQGKKTYSILYNNKIGENTLVKDRISNAIKSSLNQKNYTEVAKKSADLLFVFHVNVRQMSDIRTDYQVLGYPGYRYGPYGYGYGAQTRVLATPSVYKWTEGKLIIDALNPKTKKIVWRGIVTDELDVHPATPEERKAYVNEVVGKVMQNFFTVVRKNTTSLR